ncbi:MAG: putative O-glycosylation ligase, exosortase A system-associated [bacterium]|nr:putative O-glycosylation ligase, exosortase A system-associated [Planctomycetota bacterium]HIL53360.1 putative O-glycosylation ligase, exosortase A system-associated [Planctomycetota bacterium]
MRDIVVSLLILGALPICFRKPFVGLLLFSLLAYMRIQDLTWGFAREIRWSFYVSVVTFAGFFASSRERRFMLNSVRTAIMVCMVLLVGVSILQNRGADPADLPGFAEFSKVILIALFTTGMVNTRARLRMMLWVIALSFAFFGYKSGLMGVLSGGTLVILRGPGGMLQDNNDFALALGMGIPMLWMIGHSEKRDVLRRVLLVCVPLTMLTILMTQSRGGLLAMAAGILVLVVRSRNQLAGLAMVGLIVVGVSFAGPKIYLDRVQSIADYEQDDSAQARLAAWRTAREMIKENPVFGVGFGHFQDNYQSYNPETVERGYAQGGTAVAHNSYLQIWAECGSLAFLLYLLLLVLSLFDLWRLRHQARLRYHSSWILNYTTMFEASLVTFMLGSIFLNRAHFDLFYHWVALILAFTTIARREMESPINYPGRSEGRRTLQAVRGVGFGMGQGRRGFNRRPALESGF